MEDVECRPLCGILLKTWQCGRLVMELVPNAKPERESTDINIYGMKGIPPDVLAAHYGDQEEDVPSKAAKVDIPPTIVGALMPRPPGLVPPTTYGVMRPPTFNPAGQPPLGWQVPRPPVWYPPPPAVRMPPAVSVPQATLVPPQQPLFPVQSMAPPLGSNLAPGSQPPYQPGFHLNPATVPVSQPLFPVATAAGIANQTSAVPAPGLPSSIPSDIRTSAPAYSSAPANVVNNYHVPNGLGPAGNSHTYASGPNTGGPSIGPPPVIANKATNEVYLVWDDEAMSMEERRASLPKYQVHDETSQMNTIDAAIDRRISEGRLAGRMTF